MNTFQTLTNALVNLETYVGDSKLLQSVKGAITATVQSHPLVLSDQALIFNLRKLGEELHVTAMDEKVLTIHLAIIHPYTWEVDPAFYDLAGLVCSSLLPGMDVELSQRPSGDIFARTMSARGTYSSLTSKDVSTLTTLAMSVIILLHAINFSSHER